jgi:hypothetical protein
MENAAPIFKVEVIEEDSWTTYIMKKEALS